VDPLGLAGYFGGGVTFPIFVGPLAGGYGGATLVCKDECDGLHVYKYKKICIGIGSFGASVFMGGVSGMDGVSCKDPSRYAGYFLEFAAGFGVVGGGVDIGLTENPIHHLPGGSSGVNEGGTGVSSPGVSVMLCYYTLVSAE
jgi:hypothetical protein